MEETTGETNNDNSSCPAVDTLDELLNNGTISEETHQKYLYLWNKLQEAYVLSCKQETFIARKAQENQKLLKEQKTQIENSANIQQESRSRLSELRQQVTNLQIELDMNEERLNEVRKNTTYKQNELEKLQKKIETYQLEMERKTGAMQKQIDAEIKDLNDSITAKRQEIQRYIDENKKALEQFDKMKETLDGLDKKKKDANQRLIEVGSIPARLRAMANEVNAKNLSFLTEEKNANTEYMDLTSKLQKYTQDVDSKDKEANELQESMEQARLATVDLKIQCDEIKKKIVEATNKKTMLSLDSIHLEKQIKEENYTQSQLISKQNELEKKIHYNEKQTRNIENAIQKTSIEKQTMDTTVKQIQFEIDEDVRRMQKLQLELTEINKRSEEVLRSLLVSQSISKELAEQITDAIKSGATKQATLEKLIMNERELNNMAAESSIIRDRKAREFAQMVKKAADLKHKAQERYLVYLDLCKKAEELEIKQADITALYETVKVDRNRFISIVQSSAQLIVELKEKIKIVESEGDVLSVELNKSAVEMKKIKTELADAYKQRERTVDALGKAMNEYRKFEEQIDAQVAETERMTKQLQSIETQITTQQQRYAVKAEECMDKRRTLIDKQDALCILSEQLNQNEDILRQGEKMIKQKDEDLRMLRLQLNDFQRNVEIMYKKIPKIKKCDEEIKELKWEIANEQKTVDALTTKLENPDKNGRKRNYTGKDLSEAQLDKKIQSYEQRISEKDQQIWEAQVLYKDIKDKNDGIAKNLKKNRKTTNKISKRGGQAKADLIRINRQTKAAKSELAVMAATKLELQERKHEIEEERADSARRVQRGEAFDDYADKMIRMHERDQMLSARRKKEWFDEEEEEPHGRQKYDAYPTADGLSRPYGGFPVFQPQKPSANLRHYRRETEREIKL